MSPIKNRIRPRGFSLIEILVVVGIIAVVATIALVALGPVRRGARDQKRITDLTTMGRFLLAGECYVPVGGAGDYDLQVLYNEIIASRPQLAQAISRAPRDPRLGTDESSGYKYIYSTGACALYANLENAGAAITLSQLSAPTAGPHVGTLQAAVIGPNGSDRYYQIGR